MLFLIHLVSTAIMVGAIWVIQLVHYPSFYYIDKNNYMKFQNFHMNRISYIVIPAMTVELFSGLLIIYLGLKNDILFMISIIFLISIWLSTALLFTRIHQKLTEGYESLLIKKLVKTNWLRTILWNLRLIILLL